LVLNAGKSFKKMDIPKRRRRRKMERVVVDFGLDRLRKILEFATGRKETSIIVFGLKGCVLSCEIRERMEATPEFPEVRFLFFSNILLEDKELIREIVREELFDLPAVIVLSGNQKGKIIFPKSKEELKEQIKKAIKPEE
jgi:hypothetical protein